MVVAAPWMVWVINAELPIPITASRLIRPMIIPVCLRSEKRGFECMDETVPSNSGDVKGRKLSLKLAIDNLINCLL